MNQIAMQSKSTRVFTVAEKNTVLEVVPSAPVAGSHSHEAIANRAYDIYVRKGRQAGQCQQNWHQAQQDLTDEKRASGNGVARSNRELQIPYFHSATALEITPENLPSIQDSKTPVLKIAKPAIKKPATKGGRPTKV